MPSSSRAARVSARAPPAAGVEPVLKESTGVARPQIALDKRMLHRKSQNAPMSSLRLARPIS
jgi:hypothetical protein